MYQDAAIQASLKKVEAAREANIRLDPPRMSAEEKDALLKTYHPDYRESQFTTLLAGPNKGEKVPTELAALLEGTSRILNKRIDLSCPDYDTDVLIIGAGGAGYGNVNVDFGDLGDIFSSIFGGGFGGGQARRNGPQRGESIRASVSVTFKEAAFGCEKEVTIQRSEQCTTCKGNGCAPGTTPEICPDCHGSGVVQVQQRTPMGVFASSRPCQRCHGTGKIIHQPCADCGGTGAVRKRKTIKINIPAGIDHGQTISLRGQGNAGKNGGPAGDLLITVMVQPHELFRREGNDVFCEAPITFSQAVLGATLEIPTIDGQVKYDIPEGTQTGTVFRLRGKGIPVLNGRGRGDQYVTVNIETPRGLNREQKDALKKFDAALGDGNYEKRKSFFGFNKKK